MPCSFRVFSSFFSSAERCDEGSVAQIATICLAASSGLLLSHLAMLWCLHQWRDAQLRPAGGGEGLSPMALG